MAPNKPREESIERTAEYDEFLDVLAEYHEKRGWVTRMRVVAERFSADSDA